MNDGRRYPGWVPGMELRDDWLALTDEEVLEPELEIVDPHHHLWVQGTPEVPAVYEMDELWADAGSGHNVVQTVYIECRSYWDLDAPAHLQPVAETARVAEMAADAPPGRARIAGIVAHADLTLPLEMLDEVLDAHLEAGEGLVKGIRHSSSRDPEPEKLTIPGRGLPGQLRDPDFRRGVAHLGERGLTFDSWHFHHQNPDFLDLARAVPETVMVLDHFGTPLGVARFEGRRPEIFEAWHPVMKDLAACPNVRAKLGGFAMPDNGWGFHTRERPPGSDELVALHGDWYRHMIECFGPERCMFESNFPVDRVSVSYRVLWNAFKKLAAGCSEAEKVALFAGTARSVYGLDAA